MNGAARPPAAGGAGHRSLPHTADLIFEAWAPTKHGCLAEAVKALVETFADPGTSGGGRPLPLRLPPAEPEELLVALLEEVLYLLEVTGVVTVGVTVDDADDGGLEGSFDVVPLAAVTVVGAAPKAITRSELAFGRRDGLWRCRVIVDV
jgi:SHS2 domain-containing protein